MRRGSRGIAVPSGSHLGLTGRRSSFIPAWSGVRPRFLADLIAMGVKIPGSYFDPAQPL